jgi:hypothetical protein
VEPDSHVLCDRAHAVQAHVDVLGVQPLAMVEPILECFHAVRIVAHRLAA